MSLPVPSEESKRLQALARYDVLDTPPEDGFDRITRLAARWLQVPIALVTLLDEERQWFKSCVGLSFTQTPREQAFCLHNLSGMDLLVVEDAAADPRFSDNPLVTGPPGIRFYAGAPLTTPDGHVLGSLCVIDTEPRRAEAMDLDVLRDLADVVVRELELRAVSADLRERSRRIRSLTQELRAAQETGRSRLSHVLQEELQQVLQAARITLDTVAEAGGLPADQVERLRRAGVDLSTAVDLVETLAARFAPSVSNQPLFDTLQWLADQMGADHDLPVILQGDETAGAEAGETLKLLFYRLVRESLFLARHHGAATMARVHLATTDGRLRVVVEHDGLGASPATGPSGEEREMSRLRVQLDALGGRVAVHVGPEACVTVIEGPGADRSFGAGAPAEGVPAP